MMNFIIKAVDLLISAAPSMTLQEGDHTSSHDTILVCSVYDFYPEHILVTWYLNGQEVTEGVTISEVMTNGDCTYQVHSYLECTPIPKDRVTCTVEHVSLKEPKSSYWGEDRQDHFSHVLFAFFYKFTESFFYLSTALLTVMNISVGVLLQTLA